MPRWFAFAMVALGCGASSVAPADGPAEALDGPTEALDAPAEALDAPDAGETAAWRSLFDGATLAGWQRYLGPPSANEPPLGLENDPRGVFSVATVDGAPALHITGEIWGALISNETFCDLHLRARYKWGTKIYPPLNYRDAGLMILSTGPLGAVNAGGPALSDPPGTGAFMVSIEYQITPSDVGSIATLGPITLTRLARNLPVEHAADWNELEITFKDGVITYSLNGVEVARAQDPVISWPGQAATPLTCGKLQIQSEGAEIFFRDVEIQAPP